MNPLIKNFILFLILISFFHWLSGQAEGFGDDAKIIYPDHEAILEMKTRKLLVLEGVGDYNDGGANSRHETKRGKAPGDGSGGKYP